MKKIKNPSPHNSTLKGVRTHVAFDQFEIEKSRLMHLEI